METDIAVGVLKSFLLTQQMKCDLVPLNFERKLMSLK